MQYRPSVNSLDLKLGLCKHLYRPQTHSRSSGDTHLAMLVPVIVLVAVVDPIQALKMSVPGAATWTLAPKLEDWANLPSLCMFATVIMHLGCVAAHARVDNETGIDSKRSVSCV
jgi:hypothetical protein